MKFILIVIGTLSLVLGIIGIVLPILPTTPLLLLSSFCYIRSSKRLYNWLINHKAFGSYIKNYLIYRAINKKTKFFALILLWLSLGFTIFIVPILFVKVMLSAIGIAVSIHILKLKTI